MNGKYSRDSVSALRRDVTKVNRTGYFSLGVLTLIGAGLSFGCGASGKPETLETGSLESPPAADGAAQLAGGTDRRGIGLELAIAKANAAPDSSSLGKLTSALSTPVNFPIDSRRSLFVSDEAIVGQITLKDVLSKLAGSVPDALTLYKNFWDLQNDDATGVPGGTHCAPTLNTFPLTCPTMEGQQALDTDPFDDANLGLSNPQAYHAVALVNRLDLTDPSGADCGEFRIIFGKNPQTGPQTFSRSLVIFEAVLPNPNPTLGLVGCRDIQTFWANLSDPARSDADRGADLKKFFLDGAAGAAPVVSRGNYTGGRSGRIRTNQFFQDAEHISGLRPWVLREFVLSASGAVTPRAVTTKANPFVGLFNDADSSNRFVDFLSRPDTVRALSVNDLNGFNYPAGQVPDEFNAGQSQSSRFGTDTENTPNDYFGAFQSGGAQHRLRTRLQSTLTSLRSNLTPENIVARAQSLSCAGCHIMSSEDPQPPLGLTNADGTEHPFPPVSTPFTHVDERTTQNGRFLVSAAVEEFLLFRQQVLSNYFTRTEGFALSASVQVSSNWSGGYCVNVTLNNRTTSAASVWKVRLSTPGAKLQTPWGSTATVQDSDVTFLPPSYAAPVNARGQLVFGFCATKNVSGTSPQISVVSATGFHP
ncbi:MAG TPA: cellulose binding domain-containing protein [Polyangiaceae bacterium]|nr:cellulose binding domain-containing protein [Polyangiaceae bacterium]